MKWSPDWELSSIPDAYLASEWGRRATKLRKTHSNVYVKYEGKEQAQKAALKTSRERKKMKPSDIAKSKYAIGGKLK